ncbi:hypothetical protein IMSAGC016_00902 [Muribaculaceae bacterium]|nr:hypothetical protein IMSAGC016_00902 [Muribaculaceae bacterium]
MCPVSTNSPMRAAVTASSVHTVSPLFTGFNAAICVPVFPAGWGPLNSKTSAALDFISEPAGTER